MFIDQICQKKKAHWLRPDISEYTINNKYYVKFIQYCAHFIASPYIYIIWQDVSDNEEQIKKINEFPRF